MPLPTSWRLWWCCCSFAFVCRENIQLLSINEFLSNFFSQMLRRRGRIEDFSQFIEKKIPSTDFFQCFWRHDSFCHFHPSADTQKRVIFVMTWRFRFLVRSFYCVRLASYFMDEIQRQIFDFYLEIVFCFVFWIAQHIANINRISFRLRSEFDWIRWSERNEKMENVSTESKKKKIHS